VWAVLVGLHSRTTRLMLTVEGALCGSVYLDHAFEQYIRGVLSDKAIDNMKVHGPFLPPGRIF